MYTVKVDEILFNEVPHESTVIYTQSRFKYTGFLT